jgi:hypothetical protein
VSGVRATGVAGAVTATTLPFTGLSLFWVTLAGAGILLLAGTMLWLTRPGKRRSV